jgi:hypothetical protein
VASPKLEPCDDLLSHAPHPSPRSSLSFRTEANALVDTSALAPSVFSADVLLQRAGQLPKGFFDCRQFWWGRRQGAQPSAVNRQLEETLVHKHSRGVAVRQQVARTVELEIWPRTIA